MKQKDWFWCGTVLCVLVMFISITTIREPLYAGMAGGACAVAAVIFLGCGLRKDAQEKTDAESTRANMLETLKEEVLNQLQAGISAINETVTEGVRTLREDGAGERESIQEQWNILHDAMGKESVELSNYFSYMVGMPWEEIKKIADIVQSMSDQLESISDAVDSIQSDTEFKIAESLKKLDEDNDSLKDALQDVCKTLEMDGKENRDAMDRVIQSYSNVTAQDIEVLTALRKDADA